MDSTISTTPLSVSRLSLGASLRGLAVPVLAVITALLSRLNGDRGLTVVMVTHHLERIAAAVHSVVWVDEGRAIKKPVGDAGVFPARAGVGGPGGLVA